MTKALDDLVDILDLEVIEINIFRGVSPKENRQRVFGGQVAGQALVAAARTVPADRYVHSLHAYFLRPGDENVPILYDVDRIRDGRSFTTRRVVAIQRGEAIFNLAASFQVAEEGVSHQDSMPLVPDPDDLPTFAERYAPYAAIMGDWYDRPRPIDTRYVDTPPPFERHPDRPGPPHQKVWMRADGRLADDPVLHACILTFASDMTLLDTAILPHGLSWYTGNLIGASLDHAMWFHRPFRADEWLLFDLDSPSASGARGVGRASVFTRSGDLVATVVQEGLIRVLA